MNCAKIFWEEIFLYDISHVLLKELPKLIDFYKYSVCLKIKDYAIEYNLDILAVCRIILSLPKIMIRCKLVESYLVILDDNACVGQTRIIK